MYILGISAFYHDSAACLLRDDYIVAAAQEERFTRIKNDASFPFHAIRFCLEAAGMSLADVDHVVFYEKPFLKFERLLETYISFAPRGFRSFMQSMPLWLKDKLFLKKKIGRLLNQIETAWPKSRPILFTDHHHSHAASAFYPSPFKEAVILVADGVGEWATTSVFVGKDNRMEQKAEIRFPHSIGLLYSAFTYYLGFKVNSDEYKVMGLAPYGKPVYRDLIFDKLVNMSKDGSFRLNMKYFAFATGLTMTNQLFNDLFGSPVRRRDEQITAFHQDIAKSIQLVTEEIMLRITQNLHAAYPLENLCLAGGVALNCVCNALVRKDSGFQRVWAQPAAGDAGGALGAAFTVYHEYCGSERPVNGTDKMQQALLGPRFSKEVVRDTLQQTGLPIKEYTNRMEFYRETAVQIAGGKVVGFFDGRMEFGPRALGCRSIIADPRCAEMQQVLNQKIKFRESFRPFAPAILEEFAKQYFEESAQNPFMLFTATVKTQTNGVKCMGSSTDIPAVVHVDGSARLQTVNSNSNPEFYKLIHAFYELTGCPVLINTSFNVMNEPIVCSPFDAVQCFKASGIDVLAIEGFMIKK